MVQMKVIGQPRNEDIYNNNTTTIFETVFVFNLLLIQAKNTESKYKYTSEILCDGSKSPPKQTLI